MDGFIIYSNAGDAATNRVVRNLQSLRWAISKVTRLNVNPAVPTRIFVFADRRSFNPFRDAMFGGTAPPVAGLFQGGSDGNYVLINSEAGLGEIVYHELLHFFASNTASFSVPIWFNEGLAEFYSSFQSSGSKFYIGRAIPHHIQTVRQRTTMPLGRLVAVQPGDPEYTEQHRQTVFYAQSWALVHYLLLGNSKHREQVPQLMQLLSEGTAPGEAFRRALGVHLEQLQDELRSYVRKSLFPYAEFSADEVPRFEKEKPRPTAREDLLVEMAGMLLHAQGDQTSQARRFLDAALQIKPDHPQAYTTLGLQEQRLRNHAEARRHFEKAVSLAPGDERPYVALGEYLVEQVAQETGRRVPAAELEPARALFRKAIELNNQSARAWAGFGRTYLLTDEKPNAGITALERSWKIAPSQEDVVLNLAVLYARAGDRKRAEALLGRVLQVSQSDQMVRSARDAITWSEVEEAFELVNQGDMEVGKARLQQIVTQITNPDLKEHLEKEIARIEETERRNDHIRMYNDAVAKAKRGQYGDALKVLDELLAAGPEQALAADARALRASIKSRRPPRKK